MNNFVLPVVVVVVLISSNNANWSVSGSEGQTDLNDLKSTIKNKFDSLSLGNVSNIETINSSIPSPLEEGEKLFKEKCLRNSHVNNSYELVMEAKEQLQVCIHSLVNPKELKKEIEEAKPTGDIDLVFKKYCKKSPAFKSCVSNFASTVEVCLDEGEKVSKKTLQAVTEALLEFVCYDEGDRIALFYWVKGPECLMDKLEGIQYCLNTMFSNYNNNLSVFKFEQDQCKSMTELQSCVVAELTKCRNPTPSNMIESLFKFLLRSTPCSQFKNPAIQKS